MKRGPGKWCRWLAGAFFCVAVFGCAATDAGPDSDRRAATRVLDASEPLARRARLLDVLNLEPTGSPTADEALAALSTLVVSDRQPRPLRLAALDRLEREAPASLRRVAARALPGIDEPAVVARLARFAVAAEADELLTPLLRRYARPMPGVTEDDRPEADAVVAFVDPDIPAPALGFTDPVDRALVRLLATAPEVRAAAAWIVLSRRHDPAELHGRLAAWPGGDATDPAAAAILARLAAAADALDRLPTTAAGWDRLRAWSADPARWAGAVRASAGVRRWAGVNGAGVELRHLPVLVRTPSNHRPPPVRLRHRINDRLAGRRTVPRFDRPRVDPRRVTATLAPADLLLLQAVLDAMDDPAVAAAWFTQADADHADTTTEHGGLLTWDDAGRLVATAYPTEFAAGDRKYVSPPALIRATHTGLTHYHFHAQRHEHADYAGPGRGDLDFTDALDAATLTITFLDRDTLNVDLALPGRVVLDLGTVAR